MVINKKISQELLSRAKLLPAKFQTKNIHIENLFDDIFSNFKNNSESSYNLNSNGPKADFEFNNNQEKNCDLLNIFEKSNQETNDKNKVEDLGSNLKNLNTNELLEISKPYLFDIDVAHFANENNDLNSQSLSNKFQLPSSNKAFEVQDQNNKNNKMIDLNDENFDLDFLKSKKSEDKKKEKFILNNNKNINKTNINDSKDNSALNYEEQNLKSNPSDFVNYLFPENIDHNQDKFNLKNSKDESRKDYCNRTDNPFLAISNTNNSSNSNKNGHSFSYLNFNLENEENQSLLSSSCYQNSDQFVINGNASIINNKNPFDCNSINNIGDINDIFALSEAEEKRKNNQNSFIQVLEPTEYRKSIENTNLNNKKKIEKLLYTNVIIKKFNLKISQKNYDCDLIDIFLNVNEN